MSLDVALMLYWTLIAVGIVGSAVCSGLETGAYSLNRVRLQILDHRHDPRARTLRRLLADPAVLLMTLLIGNNIANYLGTAGLALVLEQYDLSDWQVIVLNVLIVTPLLFVFCETIPKDIASAHSDRLMYPFAPLLRLMRVTFTWTGLLPLVSFLSSGVLRLTGAGGRAVPFHPKRQVGVLVKEGVGHGLLSDEQSAIVSRVLDIGGLKVKDEMVPWYKVVKLRVDEPVATLWRLADQTSYSRFPVVDTAGKVLGVVHLFDALLHGRENCPPVRDLLVPCPTLRGDMPLRAGLAKLRQSKAALAVVTDANEKPVGVATIKDLVEPITGELASW